MFDEFFDGILYLHRRSDSYLVPERGSPIPMSYVLSFLTETSASGFALLSILNIITGAIAPVVVYLLNFFGEVNDISSLLIASDVIRYIMVPFPSFPMARAIMALIQVGNKK